ncbi:hypothetical protein DSECCO2_589430 [anaerobic digester metagenome]
MLICSGHCSLFYFSGSLGCKSLYKAYACPCRVVFKSFLPFLVVWNSQNVSLIGNYFIERGRPAEFCIFFWLDYGNLNLSSANLAFPGRELTGAWLFSVQFTLSNHCRCNFLSFRGFRHSVYKNLLCKPAVRHFPLTVLRDLRVGQRADIGRIVQDHGKPFYSEPEVHYGIRNIVFSKGCRRIYAESCDFDPAIRVF